MKLEAREYADGKWDEWNEFTAPEAEAVFASQVMATHFTVDYSDGGRLQFRRKESA